MKKAIMIMTILSILIISMSSCQKREIPKQEQMDPTETDIITTEKAKETTAETEPLETETPTEGKTGMGGTSGMCTVHVQDYHGFPFSLIDYVGEEAFYDWIDCTADQVEVNGCPSSKRTIYNFIHYFNIPREKAEELYISDSTIYCNLVMDFDLLYSDDAQAVDLYYRNKVELDQIAEKRRAFQHIKFAIFVKNESKWEDYFDTESPTPQTSMADIVKAFNVPRETLESYGAASADPGGTTYDYNYDAIYNADGSIRGTGVTLFSTDPEPALAADAAFCGIDDYYLE